MAFYFVIFLLKYRQNYSKVFVLRIHNSAVLFQKIRNIMSSSPTRMVKDVFKHYITLQDQRDFWNLSLKGASRHLTQHLLFF